MLKQVFKVSLMNFQNIGSRWAVASVIVIGIQGVVIVLTAILAMATGFESALVSGGEPDRVIVLREGSTDEMSSGLSTEIVAIMKTLPGVLIGSAELYTVADVPKKATGTRANLIVRGVDQEAFDVRPELEILEGRRFTTGRNELIVGVKANAEFQGLDIGSQLEIRKTDWEVVGIFEADGSSHESEIWLDFPLAASAFRRTNPTSMRMRLTSAADLESVKTIVDEDPRLYVNVINEQDFLETQAGTLKSIIESFAYGIATIMAIGALFAALNTMYTAVATRTIEIATLRAIGFSGFPVVCSVLFEAVLLALLGGALGTGLAWLLFNGFTVSTLNPAAFSQIAFDFKVTGEILASGFVWAVVIGFFGGLFPAIHAARVPITVALRGE